MNRIINNHSIYLLLILSNVFAQINVLDHIMKANNMNTEERRNLSRAKSHEHAGLYEEADLCIEQGLDDLALIKKPKLWIRFLTSEKTFFKQFQIYRAISHQKCRSGAPC